MEVQKLDPNIAAKIKSSSTINSLTQCATELVLNGDPFLKIPSYTVLNSLDAKSTAIAVRLNFITFRIQVVDNGEGIAKDNLKLIGQRYMTSKCKDLNQLERQLRHYGFRGEALASIISISKLVEITSKYKHSEETYSRSFNKGVGSNVITAKDRPSCGTTITVEAFLYNLPLRKKCVTPEMELVYIRRNVESLIIMHPNVSFSLRNDVTNNLILNSRKCNDIISAFKYIHPQLSYDYSLIKISKGNVTVKGLIFKEMHENNNLQYIYVNKRPVKSSRIQTWIATFFQKNKKHASAVLFLNEKNKHPVYVVNIKCPCSFVDILLGPAKTSVEFKNWDTVFGCIEKLLFSFLGLDGKPGKEKPVPAFRALKGSGGGISQINGVFKGHGFKQRSSPKSILKKMGTQKSAVEDLLQLPQEQFASLFQGNVSEVQDTEGASKNTNNICEFSNTQNKADAVGIKLYDKKDLDVQNIRKSIRPLPVKVRSKKLNAAQPIPVDELPGPVVRPQSEAVMFKTPLPAQSTNIPEAVDEQSFLSKFTNDENKGKDLIMDMFLKSTQVYNSEDDQSEDTLFELESNYFLENNITTNVNGKSKTMSVSVNIKKKIKKKMKKRSTVSKSIQTSLRDKRVSAGNWEKTGDCTIVLATTKRKVPYFKFVYQSPSAASRNEGTECKCKCSCHVAGKDKLKGTIPWVGKNYGASPVGTYHSHGWRKENLGAARKNFLPLKPGDGLFVDQTKSPYFAKPQCHSPSKSIADKPWRRNYTEGAFNPDHILNDLSPKVVEAYKYFNPQFQSTQESPFVDCNAFPKSNIECNASAFFSNAGEVVNKNETQATSLRNSDFPQAPNMNEMFAGKNLASDSLDLHSVTSHQVITPHNKAKSDLEDYTRLFITLSNRQKQQILNKELDIEKQFGNEMDFGWESQVVAENLNRKAVEEFDQEWLKQQNNFGSFTTFFTPKPISTTFKLDKRYEFLPKGLSPILKDIKEVDKSLNASEKDLLQNYILESYQNELLVTKWQNYIKNNDPKTFFEEMYKEKLNSFESCIPTAVRCKKPGALKNPMVFDKLLFDNFKVIGQVDKKFIAVVETTKRLLVLFDQHAVHERVRLEELLKSYTNATVPVYGSRFMIFLQQNDVCLLRRNEEYLKFIGLHVVFFQDGVTVEKIPLCMYNKFRNSDSFDLLYAEMQMLVNEIVNLIKDAGGVAFKNIPKTLQNIINLEACRGAIKFGDKLGNEECKELLKKLSACNLPFQCAHGRPTLVPLLTLEQRKPIALLKLNFKRIL
ncbi:hypothetical protein NQ315_009797 [Exocentrus adspersus]|uniref:Uncharacterized protein n=1 Tax=Exocentrus adspersus TaxID=1586481 RepID=A0AAV8WGQ5_9CUCU|nr:hypothetical protein NQ315_009797 [Exocentrus adspersus]